MIRARLGWSARRRGLCWAKGLEWRNSLALLLGLRFDPRLASGEERITVDFHLYIREIVAIAPTCVEKIPLRTPWPRWGSWESLRATCTMQRYWQIMTLQAWLEMPWRRILASS
jgi:hypothetical protein